MKLKMRWFSSVFCIVSIHKSDSKLRLTVTFTQADTGENREIENMPEPSYEEPSYMSEQITAKKVKKTLKVLPEPYRAYRFG